MFQRIEPGQRLESSMDGIEEFYFVVSGNGIARVGDQTIDLYKAISLTFPRGSSVRSKRVMSCSSPRSMRSGGVSDPTTLVSTGAPPVVRLKFYLHNASIYAFGVR